MDKKHDNIGNTRPFLFKYLHIHIKRLFLNFLIETGHIE